MNILSSYKKIAKEFIKEAAWDRKFGEPLPTLSSVMKEAEDDDEMGDDEMGDDNGEEEKPEPSGTELGKGDFERDDVEEELITINGKKYKAIKESKEPTKSTIHSFKEAYKKIGGK